MQPRLDLPYSQHSHPVQIRSEEGRGDLAVTNAIEYAPQVAVLVHVKQTLSRVDKIFGLNINGHQVLQNNPTKERYNTISCVYVYGH